MTTKLKIDLSGGVLEVEGSEAFVRAIYQDFKLHFIGEEATEDLQRRRRNRRTRPTSKAKADQPDPSASVSAPAAAAPAPETADSAAQKSVKLVKSGKAKVKSQTRRIPTKREPTYTLVKGLDLSAADGRPSLIEFMDAKFPITNEERNLVFLHYLHYTIKVKSITVDHIYTCYRAAKIRAPLNLEGSLETTLKQKRWIKMTKTGKFSVTPAGKLYVEKQLPKKIKN
jgi:hypothetical protein